MENRAMKTPSDTTPWLKKVGHFYSYDDLGNSGPSFIFFTVKFRKGLQEKLELKLPPHIKSVAAPHCKKQVVNSAALQHS